MIARDDRAQRENFYISGTDRGVNVKVAASGRPSGTVAWVDLAVRATQAYLQRNRAAIWSEVEGRLRERNWIQGNFDPDLPNGWGPDPHHLTEARRRCEGAGTIEPEAVTFPEGRTVTAWLDKTAEAERRMTEVRREAARKRGLYRTWLRWTSTPNLCGAVAERAVASALISLKGEQVWVPPKMVPGRVTEIGGATIPFGPLDAGGAWAINALRPEDGFIPFGIEVKNLRQTLYPWHKEVWDLLAKLAPLPEVVPILVARRIHPITFRFFKDTGALGYMTERQWFSPRVEVERFEQIKGEFGFADAVILEPDAKPQRGLLNFFSKTLRTHGLMENQAARWQRVAPIAERYDALRQADLSIGERQKLWYAFCHELQGEGLYDRGGYAAEFE